MIAAGDIALVGLRADNPDVFGFVALKTIPMGTEIFFTDNGVFSDDTFRTTEGILKWVAGTDVPAGTVIDNSDAGFSSESGSIFLSTSGDQITAYLQDSTGAITFLYTLTSNSNQFGADATSSNTTALPSSLTLGQTAVAVGSGPGEGDEFDNVWYVGPTSGTQAELLTLIGDPFNWIGSNTFEDFKVPTGFTVDVPSVDEGPDLVISEIMFNPASNEDDWEWVEVYNGGSTEVDLTGWVLDDGNSVAHTSANIASGTIGAGETAVLYNADDVSAAQFAAAWGAGINLVAVTNWSVGGLNNSGDTVGLWSSFSDYVDDNIIQQDAVVSVAYPNIDDNFGSVYLTDLTDQSSWALSADGAETPAGTTRTSAAAGGNSGSDVGSPQRAEVPPIGPELVFSEIMFNPASNEDDWEWVEIYNGGTAAIDLAGWVLDDSNSVAHSVANIAAGTINAGETGVLYNADDVTAADFEAAWGTGINLIAVTNWSVGGLNNSGDKVGLWSSFDDYADDNVTQANALISVTYPNIDDDAGSVYLTDLTDQSSWALSTDGVETPAGTTYTSAAAGGNSGSDVGSPGGELIIDPPVEPELVRVSAIQGAGDSTPLDGQTVTIEVVVTADYQDGLFGSQGDLNGFFVQEEEADYDADTLTSEGLFVFDGFDGDRTDVSVGDLVQVTGTVSEFFDKTQITATSVAIVGEATLPSAVTVDFGADMSPNLEAVEGMIVAINEMVVTEMFNLDRFGQIRVADERPFQFTQNNAPSVEGYAEHVAKVAAQSILIDDGRSEQNPFEIRIPDGDDYVLTSADSFRMGDTLQNITGVLDYSFGEYRVQTPTADYVQSNPRPDEAPDLGGNFKVASLNVLNFFTTLDVSGAVTTVGQGPRGANNAEELERQQTKIVNAITEMDADVIGLVEIENDVDSAPLATLTAAVNAALGSEVYGFINTGQVGSDAITNAIMYKLETANPIGVTDILDDDSFVDPLNSPRDGLNRPAVTQTFEHIDSGEVLTVSVNHLKSKGSLSGLAVDEDQLDGQGNNNATREKAAEVLADHLSTNPTGAGDGDVLIIGDLNAYAQEDPITMLESKGYTDLAYDALGDSAYSYVFDGQIGTLDYIMSSEGLLDDVVGVAEWHINADEADAIDYNNEVFGNVRDPSIFDGSTAARNSDHDPVIVAFQFEREFELISGTSGIDRLTGTDADERIESLGGRIDQMIGGGGVDQFVFGAETRDRLRDRDFIRDYEVGVDQIVLTDGAEISRSMDVRSGVIIGFEGGRDALLVVGRGLTFDDLEIVVEAPDILV